MDGELRRIKKLYGEDFAKFCRTAFPRILEEEGLLTETLKRSFQPTHGLYEALVKGDSLQDFKNHIFYRAGFKRYEPKYVPETPGQLMLSSDYSLYKCERPEDCMQFIRYYTENELLCTFDDIEGRLEECDVFFAVRFDADELNREDFENPEREDAYGTSVISIQFYKEDGSVSIKNRYNHSVENPDATFSNDLDNICPGLTDSFATHYGLYQSVDYEDYEVFYSGEFIQAEGNKNFHILRYKDEVYICDENWVVNENKATYYDKSRYEILDFFVLDKQEKRIFSITDSGHDSFVDEFEDIKKIDVVKSGEGKIIHVTKNDDTYFEVQVSKGGTITGYENKFQTKIGNCFLKDSFDLEYMSIPNAKTMGDNCFRGCNKLESLDMPELESIGCFCLPSNKNIVYLNLPKVKKIGNDTLKDCTQIRELSLPEVEEIGEGFMRKAFSVTKVYMPKLKSVGNAVFRYAKKLKELELPELVETGEVFCDACHELERVSLPKLQRAGNFCLSSCPRLKSVEFPELVSAGNYFMYCCDELEHVSMPKVKSFGFDVFRNCTKLKEANFPELLMVGNSFLLEGLSVESLHVPKLTTIGNDFMGNNKTLEEIDMPSIVHIPEGFFYENTHAEILNLPKAEVIEENCMSNNLYVKTLNFPELRRVGHSFFANNEDIREIYMPKLEEAGMFFLRDSRDNLIVVDIPDNVKGIPNGFKQFAVEPGDEE